MNLEAVRAASKQLRAARKAVDRATQARNHAFKTAHANGYTWRAIASAAGITEEALRKALRTETTSNPPGGDK